MFKTWNNLYFPAIFLGKEAYALTENFVCP